ncbi:MAG: ATP-binding protein [Alphaproteobacteria bacterium]|nr:ATP-binding protein [Alphaproteobacteria bacterium]
MHACVKTVAFFGISTVEVDVQVQILNGMPSFSIVGLPDKAVAESRERIRSSLYSMGISLPAKRITVNLAPADVQKEGSHYDLPIALALLVAMEILSQEDIVNVLAIGELSLIGGLSKVPGVLPAALCAQSHNNIFICPAECAQEAAWAGDKAILAPKTLTALLNHFKGQQLLPRITPDKSQVRSDWIPTFGCFSDIKGQIVAKRALEIAAAGSHNVLMSGPPGVGKSMLASRIPGILPPMTSKESLEVTMIHSMAGMMDNCGLIMQRPYRSPHHSASLVALVGGGNNAKPGEVSLAHNGVLFLDELPEFSRMALESLRQPLETGDITIARANNHVTYPARIQLIAAMNPCKCGYMGVPEKECSRAPRCGQDYLRKLSGPLLDRIDIFIDVPVVKLQDYYQDKSQLETSDVIRQRVIKARKIQYDRYGEGKTNAEASGTDMERYLSDEARRMLLAFVDKSKVSARGFYRILKLARTLADCSESDSIQKEHIAESIEYRTGY